MRDHYGFITPCSNGDTINGCPESNYSTGLDNGDLLVPDLVETQVPIVGKDGCINCAYLKFQKELEEFEELFEPTKTTLSQKLSKIVKTFNNNMDTAIELRSIANPPYL